MNGRALYNENDDFMADWLEGLIAANLIAPGIVDRRSVIDLIPAELAEFSQVHLFAGLGGWSRALRGAGWPDDRQVWTWSEPCQPFSQAGAGLGFADERYLRPFVHHLVSQCRPATAFGEQVASKDGLAWGDVIQSDMEGEDYAFWCPDICSAGFGAPHIRQRLYWVADANEQGSGRRGIRGHGQSHCESNGAALERSAGFCAASLMADADCRQRDGIAVVRGVERDGPDAGWAQGRRELESCCQPEQLADADNTGSQGRSIEPSRCSAECVAGPGRVAGGMANANVGHESHGGIQRSRFDGQQSADDVSMRQGHQGVGRYSVTGLDRPGPTNGFWSDPDWLYCRDGKWRPVESGTFPLAHGLPRSLGTSSAELRRLAEMAGLDGKSLARAKAYRVGSLGGYGNAINIEQATEFVRIYLDAERALP